MDLSRAVGYYRVSTEGQAVDSNVLDRYRHELISAGVPSDDLYFDIESGGKRDRDGLNAALKRVTHDAGKDIFVVPLHTRLHRDLATWVEITQLFKDHEIKLVELDEGLVPQDLVSASGALKSDIKAVFSAYERNRNKEYSRRGHAFRRSQSKVNRAPFGYTKDSDGRLAPNTANFPGTEHTYIEVAALMVIWFVELQGYAAVVRRCGEVFGSHPERDKSAMLDYPKSGQAFKNWLKNPVLRGNIQYLVHSDKTYVTKGDHLAIIDAPTWSDITRIMTVAGHNRKNSNVFKPLGGQVFCGICHKKLRRKSVRKKLSGGRTQQYEYWACVDTTPQPLGTNTCPEKNRIPSNDLLDEVISKLCNHALEISQWGVETAGDSPKQTPEMLKLEQQINALKLMNDPALAKVIADKEHELSRLIIGDADESTEEMIRLYQEVAAKPDFWEKLQPSALRVICLALIEKVVIHSREITDISDRVEVIFKL